MNIKELRNLKVNTEVYELLGWVNTVRDHGGLTFIDLRDYDSFIQLVIDDNINEIEKIKNEFYISISGIFKKRDPGLENKKQEFGDYEIQVTTLNVINKSKSLPFQIEDKIETDESIRLKYRYLDLRRNEMKQNILARSKVFKSIRNVMNEMNVLEIDTPTLIKSTPEGAKDFIVPSRKNPGTFYALPQSPQMYKQLFMMSGFPNYYQIAKCYRDEDSRKDRQPEFTQLDLEFSNANPNLVKNNVEKIIKNIFSEAFDLKINSSFPSLSFHDAINLYGTDKPDLRIKETINDATNIFSNSNVSFIKDSIDSSGVFKYLFTPKILTRKEIDNFDTLAKELGSNGLGWIKYENQNFSGPLAKHMSDNELTFVSALGEGTFLFQVGNLLDISKTMDMLRTKLYERSEKEEHVFLWVEDFPYFEIENNVLQPSHHPFTSPQNVDDFENNPIEAIALHYDLVLNGVELGSGSQRINNPDLQTLVLKKWGLSDSEIEKRFGWFIEALSYGTPQHAGFAIGIDRLVAEVMKQHSIRDVIPFPKTQSGMDPLTDATTTLDSDLLEEYNLKVIDDNE